MWTHRIMLEALQYEDNAFVTLTYSDEFLPAGGSLNPKHLQDWLKRFRKKIEPARVRYYAVGEYGDESQRPHFHIAVFGFPACDHGSTLHGAENIGRDCCASCRVIFDTWGMGNIFVGTLELHSAQYIAGYVTKKMTSPDDERLQGRHPEFCRMSLRPGIGADAMHDVASELMRFNLENTQADVPVSLRHGSKTLPLGRYLRRKLRTMVGKDEKTPESVVAEAQAEVRAVYEATFDSAKYGSQAFKKGVVALGEQRVRQMEARKLIHKERKQL